MARNIIPQTNRTILFEEINPEKLDLVTLIGDVKDLESLDDEKVNEINKHLLVRSFEEFLEKFDPKVYSYFDANNQSVRYLINKPAGIPDENITEIPVNLENSFFKMLCSLIDTRKSIGEKNVDFKFENVLDMISPKKVMEDIKQVRKEISYLFGKYDELDEEDPLKLEYGDKLNLKFEEASINYNNVLAMLPLAMEDIKTRVLLGASEDGSETEKIQIGVLTLGENGELKVIENKKAESDESMLAIDDKSSILIEAFKADYEEINEDPNEYVGELVARTFVPVPAVQNNVNVEQEVANFNQYLDFYKSSQEEFIKVARPLIEKLLGIKMFFDQYSARGRGMTPSMLITNIKLEMLTKPNNKTRIEKYLNTVNSKNDFTNTIWYGIVPSVELDVNKTQKTVRERFMGSKKKVETVGNTIGSLASIMDLLHNYKVQVFFNFEATHETTFSNMATMGIDKYAEKTDKLQNQNYSEYLIACLPNFTVVPKDKSGVILDSKLLMSEAGNAFTSKEKQDIQKLWIEGVYLDSAYVAAGVTAAYQCPEFLRKAYRNVAMNNPGVRFDIESGNNNLKVTTTLSKEISGFTESIKNSINRRNFGFVFSSESAQLGTTVIKNIMVYKARNLSTNDDGEHESIYKTQVSTYIERMLRYMSGDFKEDKLVSFFSNNPKSQKSKWLNEMDNINSILQSGDDISHLVDNKTNTCQLNLLFNGNVKNLEVNITKN